MLKYSLGVIVLVALRVRFRWERINGRLRLKLVVIAWSCPRIRWPFQ
jgi:hypothetical protein